MPEIDLTPFLAEPITVTVGGERVTFPAEMDVPDVLLAWDLYSKWAKEPDTDDEASMDASVEALRGIYEFLLEIARRYDPKAERIPIPPSMLARLLTVLVSGGVGEGDNLEALLLEIVTGKTADERAAMVANGKGGKADPTGGRRARSSTRSRRASTASA